MNFASILKTRRMWSSKPFTLSKRLLSTSKVLSRESFVRDKANVNLITLGATQHGKTALASRLTKVLASHGVPTKEVHDIDHSVSEKENGRSETVSHMELWKEESQWRYSLADLPGSFAYLKNTLNHLPHADAALLVISPDQGVVSDTRMFYHLASHLELPLILPVISMRGDTDQETLELVMMELEELEGIRNPIVLDDPMNNDDSVIALMDEIEKEVNGLAVLNREVDTPFYMVLEQVGNIPKRGDFCAGRVLKGKLAIGDQIEAFYQGKSSKGNVKDLEIFKKGTASLQAGDRGGAFVKLKSEMDFKRGGVLFDPKIKVTASDNWEVSLKSVPGFGSATLKGDCVLYSSTVTDGKVTLGGNIDIKEDSEEIVKMKLSSKIIGKPGHKIIIRNNQTFALGTIVS
eukprot:GFUD01000831.1.p1 GENE.GFUD01000831.1~~GFUD01000831.1.p1  ORF type:complete len:405 (+),score=112.31 GFUD01000831.1:48-1262(+)